MLPTTPKGCMQFTNNFLFYGLIIVLFIIGFVIGRFSAPKPKD